MGIRRATGRRGRPFCRAKRRQVASGDRYAANPGTAIFSTRHQKTVEIVSCYLYNKKKDKARLISATGTERKAACIDQIREENR